MISFARTTPVSPAGIAAAAFLLAAPLAAEDAKPDGAAGMKLTATLSGGAEVPGPGDSDGTGSFSARLIPGKGELCYKLVVSGIAAATGAHIHTGAATEAGPVASPLTVGDGTAETCTTIATDLAHAIARSLAGFYVNVHNAEFPNGAVRGQLTR